MLPSGPTAIPLGWSSWPGSLPLRPHSISKARRLGGSGAAALDGSPCRLGPLVHGSTTLPAASAGGDRHTGHDRPTQRGPPPGPPGDAKNRHRTVGDSCRRAQGGVTRHQTARRSSRRCPRWSGGRAGLGRDRRPRSRARAGNAARCRHRRARPIPRRVQHACQPQRHRWAARAPACRSPRRACRSA